MGRVNIDRAPMSGPPTAAKDRHEAEPDASCRADGPEPAGHDRTEVGSVLLRLQRTHGNRYVQRLLQAPASVVQPKLQLGPAGDRFEREADRVAEEIGADSEEEPRRVTVRPHDGRSNGGAIDPAVQRLLRDAPGRGRPLPANVRRRYEQSLGAGLADVRLHTDGRADELNLRLRSSAFTTGHHIFFRRGEYDPTSEAGHDLLTHELVHVVQQGGGGDASTLIQRGKRKNKGTQGPQNKKSKKEEEEEEKSEEEPDDTLYDESLEEADEDWLEDSEEEPSTDIPVEYLDVTKMEHYLERQGLEQGRDPKPVSVGVVVWNINHLKADDKADDEDNDDGGTKADDMDLDDQPEASYDTGSIAELMGVLQRRLTKVASTLTSAIDAEIEKFPKKAKSEAVRSARRELRQLKADIHVIRELELDQVLMPGIEAMRAQTADRRTSAIDDRANQLERVRKLNRVWQRLKRLRVVLISGNTNSSWKAGARDIIRGTLTEKDDTLIGQTTAGLLELLPVAALDKAISALKRETVIDLTTRTFLQNKAVNLVLINEMNLGIRHLDAAARKRKLGLSRGPIMLARGQQPEEGSESRAGITAGDDEQVVVGKQYEFYPAVYREGDQGLAPRGTFYVNTSGEFAVQRERRNQAIPWNKGNATFRGIVVHRFTQGGQEFWAGVLHTTPAGKDLNRKKIWPQIEAPLTNLNRLALRFRIPLFIGGDFYIPAEGIVNAPVGPQKTEVEDMVLLRHVKASNIARSVFLTAATQGQEAIETLIKAVETMSVRKTAKSKAEEAATAGAMTGGHNLEEVFQSGPELIKPGDWHLGHMTATQLESYWKRYRAAVSTLAMNKRTGRLALTIVKDSLAPDQKLGPLWSKTLAGGTLTQLDILRNYRRIGRPDTEADPEPRLTMQRALAKLGYRIMAAGSPTNPKESGRGENKMQIADLFIVNTYWRSGRSGIVMPGTGQLKPMDDAGLSATKTYWKISDHSPVLMLSSTDEYAPAPYDAFDLKQVAVAEAMEANRREWEGFRKELAKMRTAGINDINLSISRRKKQDTKAREAMPETVDEVIDGILKLLDPQPIGPTKVVEEISARAKKLAKDIRFANQVTPEVDAVLNRLSRWDQPYYPVDFSEKSPTDDLAGIQMPGSGSSPAGEKVPPGPGAPGVGDGGVEPDYPLGEIEHGWETCYLAALIHVFASHTAFTNLLSAERNPIADASRASTQKSLGELVTLLRDPKATIRRGAVERFVLDLDQIGGILARRSPSTINPSKTKPLKEEAAQKARQAIADQTAYGLQQDAAEILAQLLERLGPPKGMWVETESILAAPGADEGTASYEDHLTISLGLGTKTNRVRTVSEALRRFTDVEVIEETKQQKQLLFSRLPGVLTLVLKRFRNVGGQTSKIEWAVKPDDPLVIPDDCLSGELAGQKPTYRLVHVVHHIGASPHSGHYTSWGKLTGTEQWYRHDDTDTLRRRRLKGDPTARPAEIETGYIYVYARIQ